jgi:polyisoprenoid-binding protein YceI
MKKMTQCLSALLLTMTAAAALAAPETYVLDGSHTYPRFS